MRIALAAISAALILLPAALRAEGVTTFTLDNGMEVVVIQDHRAPVVTHMVWYKVGAADEPRGLSGMQRPGSRQADEARPEANALSSHRHSLLEGMELTAAMELAEAGAAYVSFEDDAFVFVDEKERMVFFQKIKGLHYFAFAEHF